MTNVPMRLTIRRLPPLNHSAVKRLEGEAVGDGLQLGDALAVGLRVAQCAAAELDSFPPNSQSLVAMVMSVVPTISSSLLKVYWTNEIVSVAASKAGCFIASTGNSFARNWQRVRVSAREPLSSTLPLLFKSRRQKTDWAPYGLGRSNTTQVPPVLCSSDEYWNRML